MANSRIYELPDYVDLTGVYFPVDITGNNSATKVPLSYVTDLIDTERSRIDQNEDDISDNAAAIIVNSNAIADIACKLIGYAKVALSGTVTASSGIITGASRVGPGSYTVSHSKGDTNYFCVCNTKTTSIGTVSTDNTAKVAQVKYNNNSVELVTADDNERDDSNFEIAIFEIGL